MNMTGHANSNSLTPYLQLDADHHGEILNKMRVDGPSTSNVQVPIRASSNVMSQNTANVSAAKGTFIYNNCNTITLVRKNFE